MSRFEKFAEQQINSLLSHLQKWHPLAEPETLHRIRVDIKKIKAILSLIAEKRSGFKAKRHYKLIRDIFRGAGAIHDPAVLSRILNLYQKEEIKYENITDGNKKPIADFYLSLPHFICNTISLREKLRNFLPLIRRDDVERYILKKKKKIKRQLWPRPQMGTIHKTRKEIKQVIYLSSIGYKSKKKEQKFYNQAEELIGNLHDKQQLLHLLKTNKDPALIEIKNSIKSACLFDEKEILSLTNDWYRIHKK